ncbi:Protein yippee-like 2, partial [Varanus komodoensis]
LGPGLGTSVSKPQFQWWNALPQGSSSLTFVSAFLPVRPLQVDRRLVLFPWSLCQCVEPAPHLPTRRTTAFTCVFQCFPCDPSCGGTSWATPEFAQRSVAPMVKMTRSKTFQAYLPSCHRTYSCIHCRAHLANHDELISKVSNNAFLLKRPSSLSLASYGIPCKPATNLAALRCTDSNLALSFLVNVGCGPAEERVLLTGLHAVADIYCENCKTTLGWKYEHAFESSQKYKEGKYIIELAHMIKDNGWD